MSAECAVHRCLEKADELRANCWGEKGRVAGVREGRGHLPGAARWKWAGAGRKGQAQLCDNLSQGVSLVNQN